MILMKLWKTGLQKETKKNIKVGQKYPVKWRNAFADNIASFYTKQTGHSKRDNLRNCKCLYLKLCIVAIFCSAAKCCVSKKLLDIFSYLSSNSLFSCLNLYFSYPSTSLKAQLARHLIQTYPDLSDSDGGHVSERFMSLKFLLMYIIFWHNTLFSMD